MSDKINDFLKKKSHEHGEHGDTMPTQKMDAIQGWHGAYARIIAYAWKHWANDEEMNNIITFPEYYLAKFGFNPQITSYKTKIKFVIKEGDRVEYVHGRTLSVGEIGPDPDDNFDKFFQLDLGPIPTYSSDTPSTVTIKPLVKLFQEHGVHDKTEVHKRKVIIDVIEDETKTPLTNGWGKAFEDFSKLTGVFVAVIPPKPENKEDELQGLNDYMELCINQPFTCA